MKNKIPRVVGIGLKSDDGCARITTGEGFVVVHGSQETHAIMTEKIIKISEKLKKRGKTIDTATFNEFDNAAKSVGLISGDEPAKN